MHTSKSCSGAPPAWAKIILMRWIINWILSATALLIVAQVVPGFYVRSFTSALWAALIIGVINATLGIFVKILTFPLTVITLGIFWLVVNAVMLEVASLFAPGFTVTSFFAAFIGAIVLSLVNMFLRWLVWPEHEA
jgi:putative membrane protein